MTNPSNLTFDDGFPREPLSAVEFSYFLSDGEKQEWREWIKTATPEQQQELVDILHSMWQDNQKNAVPESFANNQAGGGNFANTQQNQPFAQNTTANSNSPSPFQNQQNNNFSFNQTQPQGTITENKADTDFAKIAQPQPSSGGILSPAKPKENKPFLESNDVETEADLNFQIPSKSDLNFNPSQNQPSIKDPYKTQEETKKKIKRENINMDNLLKTKQSYAPNPLLENPFSKSEEENNINNNQVKSDGLNNKSNTFSKTAKATGNSSQARPQKTQNNDESDESIEIDYKKVKQRRAKEELAEIYEELNQNMEYQRKYTGMIQKIAVVMESYDQVADYFEKIMDKVLKLNDIVVDVKSKQVKTSSQSNSLTDEVHDLKRDLNLLDDRFTKEKRYNDKRFSQVSSELSGLGVDVFGLGGGYREKIKMLETKIDKLEKKLDQILTNTNNNTNSNTNPYSNNNNTNQTHNSQQNTNNKEKNNQGDDDDGGFLKRKSFFK